MSDQGFSATQQEYLKGFMAGVEAQRGALGLPAAGSAVPAADAADINRVAQDRTVAAGGKLTAEEQAKRKQHPLDRFDEISAMAAAGTFPKGTDIFLAKFHGLFYVAPSQNAFMCRVRIPGGILTASQVRGLAAIADELGGGYADITTRANVQIREIPAGQAAEMLLRLSEIGLTSRGSGADNVRNVTGSPTAGIDPQELIDTRPYTRALHHFILHHRELYGLPRKFNVAFDGGGAVSLLEDTNDIALAAVRVADGYGVAPGVYFRLGLGGITGHHDFARETGVIVRPADAVLVCNAIVRAFIAQGDRTDRTKARLKYVLDRVGLPAFVAEVERELGAPLLRVDAAAITRPPAHDKHGHIGVHAQKQAGRCYIGVVCKLGRLTSAQLRGLAEIAERFGSGSIRLTVWQNLLISDIPDECVESALAAIRVLGLDWRASPLRGGLVACTGNVGCKFSASDTKRDATDLVDWLESRIDIDHPINIHLTGCHHSCAQHYVADIGLLATKVERGEDMVEAYDLLVGGGAGAEQKLGRLVRGGVTMPELRPLVLALLRAWQSARSGPEETFHSYIARQPDAALLALCDAAAAAA